MRAAGVIAAALIYWSTQEKSQALDQVDAWCESPSLVLLAEGAGYWPVLRGLLAASRVRGPQVHDARVAALCHQHGVRELWSADRDFGRFPELRLRNPLVDPP